MDAQANLRPPPAPRIWFGVFGAPAAWTFQGLAGWYFAERACYAALDYGLARGLALAASLAALVVSIVAFKVGLTAWRGSQDRGFASIAGNARSDFLAAAAMLVSAAFALAIVLQLVATALVRVCELGR